VSGQLQVDGAPPAVEFDQVSLAFDEHVVLADLSLSIPKGAMRIRHCLSLTGRLGGEFETETLPSVETADGRAQPTGG
jgi:hypothetical protein